MDKRIVLYIIAGIFIFVLLVFTFYPGIITAWGDIGKSADEKCKTPIWKTDAEWREHMSHHPDIYRECLG